MRILSVTAQKASSTGSGVYLMELVKGFAKMGHEQAVMAGAYIEDHIELPEGVAYYPVYFKSEELPFAITGMSDEMPYESTRYSDMTEEMTEQFVHAFRGKILQVIEEFQPDVILCHHLYFLTALVRNICPDQKVYGLSHGSDMRQVKKNVWKRDFIKDKIAKLNGILALHEEQKEEICSYYHCEPEDVMVIGTGYNSDVFYRTGSKKENDKLRLIFAGKISEKKGVKSLLRSLRYIPDAANSVELLLAGGYGNEKEYGEILELAGQCPCNVRFLGRLSHKDLAKELNQSDIFVLPSFYEGLPLVVIEAMACGLNVVCTDLPGIQNWLHTNLPTNEVVFVKPPKMRNEDEPREEELPGFEQRLAEAILKAQKTKVPAEGELKRISWDGLCQRLIKMWQ